MKTQTSVEDRGEVHCSSSFSLIFCLVIQGHLSTLCSELSNAAAKSLQSCPTPCDPIDSSPPGSPIPGFSRQEHWSGLPFPSPMHESEKWKWSRSVVSNSSGPHGLQPNRLLRPWDFSRQEYWSGLPLPSRRVKQHPSTKGWGFPVKTCKPGKKILSYKLCLFKQFK